MFKDYGKYLSTSINVYLFVLIIVFIMKLVGLDYFGLDLKNPTMNYIEELMKNNWIIRDIIFFIPLWIDQFIIFSISSKDNSKRMFIYNLIIIPIYYIFEINKLKWFGNFAFIFECLYFTIMIGIFNKGLNKKIIIRFLKFISFMMLVQLISIFTRFNISAEYVTSLIANIILNLDYTVILIITYKLYFMKGDENKCYQEVQYSSLLKQINLKKLLQKWQRNFQNKKKSKTKINKVENLTNKIYMILYILWNLFTLICILFIGKLNDTFIECIFIIFSFIISKSVFGKAFHLSNMIHCFIVSNLTYYVLNRITTPLGISILVPIMLGVGLSYFTSKLVKKTYKPLYKGMPKELFEETILKVVDKDSDKYKICYDYFILKKNALYLSGKYCYSEPGIRKIVIRVNEKIKGLK